MATSTYSYRRSTNLSSSSGDNSDAALQSKLEQARRQRTSFYRRLAETGARVQAGDDATDVDVDVDVETRRRRRQLDTSPQADVASAVSTTSSSVVEQIPEPRSSWRYYTSYDNGEWRRHATPIYKADAELDGGVGGKLGDRRSASMTTGLTSHDDVIDIEDNEGASSHSKSALTRQRLRGSACLTRDRPPSASTSATDTGPTTLDEVKMVMKDVFDRSRYGSSYDVSELVQKILGERLRQRDPSPPRTENRVLYANPDRSSILDNVTQPLRPISLQEIPEGSDEKDFEEKTLAPSGRRWTSSPSPDSQQIIVVRNVYDDDYVDGGLRYEDISAGGVGDRVAGTSLENWRESSCQSPSNVPNGEEVEVGGLEARWAGAMPPGSRTVVTSETTREHERQTVTDSPSSTSMFNSRKDAFGRRIPADAVEIKVQMQRGDEHPSTSKSRFDDTEQWQHGTSASSQHGFVGGERDENLGYGGGAVRHGDRVDEVPITSRTSSGEQWSRGASTKSADDGRIWIPVIHVSEKNEATKSEASPSLNTMKTEIKSRSDETVSPVSDSRRQTGSSARSSVDVDSPRQTRSEVTDSRQSVEEAEVAGADRQSTVTSSLRTGSGVGSYGFRSSIVVDPRATRPVMSSPSTSRSVDVVQQQSADDSEWIVEKALY